MAHVHGAAAGAAQMGKSAGQGMMAEGMSGMMMGEMIKHGMTSQTAKGVAATGVVAAAGSTGGKSWLGKFLSHPLVLFGLGVAVGYTVHKYRKEIIQSANRTVEQSKDFILQQRENLEDIVAEGQEPDKI